MPEPILLTLAHYARLRRWHDVRFHAAAWIFRWLMPDYYLSLPRLLWFKDAGFRQILQDFAEPFTHNASRRLMLMQLVRLIAAVPGDTAECGVYRGLSSYLIATGAQRTHHAFDSFQGLSQPSVGYQDSPEWQQGDMAISLAEVAQRLGRYPNIRFYPGWIPERFEDVEERMFAFVHLDVDLYWPTHASLEFFYPRLNPGGILVCDDYGFDYTLGAKQACDEFLAKAPEKMILLPGGGAFMIKGCVTAS